MTEEGDNKPRLPNECLALIIRNFAPDIEGLHNLLFVSRFFFHTALPLLMHDVFITWHLNLRGDRDNNDKEILMALVVVSVIHYNQRSTSDPLFPQNILRKFGLELVWPASMDLVSRCLEPGAKMTTDYSKHFTILSSYFWDETDYSGILHLKDDNHDSSIGQDESANPAAAFALRSPRPDSIVDRIANFLLYYNYEHVVDISIHINETTRYLPLADKMVRLKTIRLSRDDDELPQEDLAAFLDFLRIHNSAFPYKRCLEIDFGSGWTKIHHDHTPESQRWVKTFNQGFVTICKGLGRIYALDSTGLIDFYTLWEDTDLSHLEELEDKDFCRWQHGEKLEDQVSFFKRCHNLRSLNLATKLPDMFSWAVDQNKGTRSRCLPELQHIKLQYVGTAPDAVKVLRDATTAFAPSLRTVTVECFRYESKSIPPTHYVGQALDHWSLPWMTHLKIDIPKLHGLRIGSLDQCSMLTSLILCFGAGNPPQDLEADDRTLELFPKWTLPKLTKLDLDYTPALLFNYDSLETMSSLRQICFYAHEDSELMQHVHKIPRLSAHVTPLQDPESVVIAPEPLVDGNSEKNIPAGKGTRWVGGWSLPLLETLTLQGPPSFVFCFDWLKGCPRLQYLDLYCSDNSQRLPLSWDAPCALTLLPMTEPAEIPGVDAYSPTQQQLYQPLGPFSGNVEDPPLLGHQLESLKMYGRWVMSEQDFVRVLTHYAPNLKNLDVESIHEFNDANAKGYQIVHLILEADRIRRELERGDRREGRGLPKEEEKIEEEDDPLPYQVDYSPRKSILTMARTDYWIYDSQINDLGMAVIGGDLVEKYTSAGLRVYSFCSRYFADTVNHTFIELGSDEEKDVSS
ncbi:hypothetical protein BGZ93_009068 [Podila epicladia]|nr:hypothetical protein BGZ92_007077 [Podila epicladia]KAG0090948.1 hypothetical protein BGZ93_009068 [Podila epicladia]